MRRLAICGALLLGSAPLAAQAGPKVPACDSAAVLLQAPPTFGVGLATIRNTCGTFASWLETWAAAQDTAAQRVVATLVHGRAPVVVKPAPADTPTVPVVVVPPPPSPALLAANDFESGKLAPDAQWTGDGAGNSIIDDPTGSGHGKVFKNAYTQSSTPKGFADINHYVSWNPRSGLGHGSTTWFRGDLYFPKNTVNFTEPNTLRKLTYWRTGDGGTNQCDFVIGMYGNQVFVSVVVPGTTEIMDWNVAQLAAGQWIRLELGVVMNSAPGVADGSVTMFLDGKQVYSRGRIAFTRRSDPASKSWIWLTVGHQREGNGKESSISEERYWDNLAFSTTRIR